MDRLITINSTNPNKIAEYERILGAPVAGVKIPIPESQMGSVLAKAVRSHRDGGDPFNHSPYLAAAAELAATKAKTAYQMHGSPVLVEDTWLSLNGLRGEPGPFYSQWECEEYNRELCDRVHILPKLRGEEVNDRAVAVVTLAMWKGAPDLPSDVWQGVTVGRVPERPRGENGFGWDTIFIPLKDDGTPAFFHSSTTEKPVSVGDRNALLLKTFAELSAEEKDSVSMRTRALYSFLSKV